MDPMGKNQIDQCQKNGVWWYPATMIQLFPLPQNRDMNHEILVGSRRDPDFMSGEIINPNLAL